MDSKEISWIITPETARKRRKAQLRNFLISLPGIGLFVVLEEYARDGHFWQPFWTVFLGSLAVAGIITLLNSVLKQPERRYELNFGGAIISSGGREKIYRWEVFEGFYRKPRLLETPEIPGLGSPAGNSDSKPTGEIFILKIGPAGWFDGLVKRLVFVYALPDNAEQVHVFLSAHLQNLPYKPASDSGLCSYEFK